jgi:3-phenylpropionate/trans-cinnamate dioxygenase ferredoxin reductase component
MSAVRLIVAVLPQEPIVILGAGMSGGVAAKTLREEGFDGGIVMIGHEPTPPFGRPPLSKTYLRGEETLTNWLVNPADWYEQNDVERLSATAIRVDARARRVYIKDARDHVSFEKLLITTGGENRRLDVPGANLPGIHQLRTVADSDAIRQDAVRGARAVVVGMGFIGCEVAASLTQLGVDVSAVFPGASPLESVLGPELGRIVGETHSDEGVKLLAGDAVVRFEGTGRVEAAITKSGRRLECDLAIVSVGIHPAVDVLPESGVSIDNGVLVDEMCRTNVPGIFAAGDVANHQHPLFGRIRVEHYNNAEKQGAAAARSMLGVGAPHAYLHTFWSDQYEHKLEYAGHAKEWDQFVVRGSIKDRKLVGFYLADGVLKAAVGLDRGGDPELDQDGEMAAAARLVAKRARPDPRVLADEDAQLDRL